MRVLQLDGEQLLTAPLSARLHQKPQHYYGGLSLFGIKIFLLKRTFTISKSLQTEFLFSYYGQESIRFLQMMRGLGGVWPKLISSVCSPIWLIRLPIIGLACPLLMRIFDRFDTARQIIVGYHVRTKRGQPDSV